jgi:hypothetical protein
MSDGAIDVVQGVQVLDVAIEGDEIRVDVYGGEDCLCGVVLYRFPDPDERDHHFRTLSRWRDDETCVTYVCRDGLVSLIEEEALFNAALGVD